MFDLSVPWWELVVRCAVVYFSLLFLLRVSGKRQLGQLSPFDLMLLLLISEAVQNAIIASDDSLLGGLIAAVTLITVNYLVALLTFKNKRMEKLMEGRPQVLIHEGKVFEEVLQNSRLTRKELDSSLRHQGYFDIKEIKLAILETNGTVSIQGYNDKSHQP